MFSVGRLEGMAVLASMRAVSNFNATLGFSTSMTPKIVGYGYSGGAVATGWTAQLKNSYAAELDVRGWAMGGTPANLTGTAVFLDETTFAAFCPAGVCRTERAERLRGAAGAGFRGHPHAVRTVRLGHGQAGLRYGAARHVSVRQRREHRRADARQRSLLPAYHL